MSQSIVEAIVEPISNGKLKTAMDVGTIDNNVKNMHVHTKKDGVLYLIARRMRVFYMVLRRRQT
eukprot:scaffold299227_cov57-Attheya_sp.AAC.1